MSKYALGLLFHCLIFQLIRMVNCYRLYLGSLIAQSCMGFFAVYLNNQRVLWEVRKAMISFNSCYTLIYVIKSLKRLMIVNSLMTFWYILNYCYGFTYKITRLAIIAGICFQFIYFCFHELLNRNKFTKLYLESLL